MRCTVLGAISVNDSVPGSPLERKLLAALLVSRGAPVAVDQLVHILWGDAVPASATNSLQSKVSRVRHSIGRAQVKLVGNGYVLDLPPGACDADRFADLVASSNALQAAERVDVLDQALALWNGQAYEEFAHEDFARASAVGLEQQRFSAEESRLQALVELGRYDDAVASSETLIESDPFREGFWAARMEAMARSGQRVTALRCYSTAYKRFVDETGMPPSSALSALEDRIRSGEFEQHDEPSPAAEMPSASDKNVASSSSPQVWGAIDAGVARRFDRPLRRPPLFQRENQRAQLEDKISQSRHGTPRVLSITGPVGVGKTSLAEALCSAARSLGTRVLDGRCLPDVPLPLGALGQIATAVGVDATLGASANETSDDLLNSRSVTATSMAVLRMLDRLLEEPTIVVLDDLQWADELGVNAIELLASEAAARAQNEPVPLTIILLHPEHSGSIESQATLARIGRQAYAETIVLEPLDEPAVAAMIAAMTGVRPSGVTAATVEKLTGGIPLLVRTMIDAWSRSEDLIVQSGSLEIREGANVVAPADLDAALHARWRELEESARSALTVLALCPILNFVPLAVVTNILGAVVNIDAAVAIAAIDDIVRAGFLAGGSRLRFASPRIAGFVRDQVPHAQRASLFESVTHELTEVPRFDQTTTVADRFPDLAIYALREAAAAGALVEQSTLTMWAARAAQTALRVGAWSTAAEHLRLLATYEGADLGLLVDGTRVDLALGLAEFRSHNEAAAQDVLYRAALDAAERGDSHTHGIALLAIQRISLTLPGDGGLPIDADQSRDMLKAFVADHDPAQARLAALGSSLLAEEAAIYDDIDAADAFVARARSLVSDASDELVVPEIDFAAGLTAANALRLSASEQFFRQSSANALDAGDRWVASWGAGRLIMTRLLAGDLSGASDAINAALAIQQPIRMWSELALTRAFQASHAAFQADYEGAINFAEESESLALRSAYSTARFVAVPAAAFAHCERGDVDKARSLLNKLARETNTSCWPYFALVDLAAGDTASAHEVAATRAARLKNPPSLGRLPALCACTIIARSVDDQRLLSIVSDQLEWLRDRGVRQVPNWPEQWLPNP